MKNPNHQSRVTSHYTFGPVNSRRFGISLGIDLSPDVKSCNFDCLYCELKSAKPISFIQNPPKVEDIISEVKEALKRFSNIDVITITSNGEPTLYNELESLVDQINRIKKDKKLLILSNGSTICEKRVQNALKKIDIVKLSLDCATQKCFKKIDRAIKGIEIEELYKCMEKFSKESSSQLVIEILLVKGINDSEDEIKKINEVLQSIKPNRVDIGTIDRPPAYKVNPVSQDKIDKVAKEFTNLPLSIIYKNRPSKKEDFNKSDIMRLLSRRPQSSFDIENFFSNSSKKILKKLLEEKLVVKKDIAGVIFYTKA